MYKKVVIIILLTIILLPGMVLATQKITNHDSVLNVVAGKAEIDTGKAVEDYIGQVINIALALVSSIFLVLMVYAGILWMTARGEEEKITKARETIIMASIGLVIVVSSYAITSFILTQVRAPGSVGSNIDDYKIQGCCLDLLRVPPDDFFEVSYSYLTWKVVSKAECETIGNNANNPYDNLYGPGTYWFYAGEDANACEKRFDEEDKLHR
jgi:hypothetical protein